MAIAQSNGSPVSGKPKKTAGDSQVGEQYLHSCPPDVHSCPPEAKQMGDPPSGNVNRGLHSPDPSNNKSSTTHAAHNSHVEHFFAAVGQEYGRPHTAFDRPVGNGCGYEPMAAQPARSPASPYHSPANTQSTHATDLAAEYTWLREERQRLEAYTLNQLGVIAKQREDLSSRRTDVEAALALREQELNRQIKLLTERTESVQHREQEIARKEAEWSLRQEEIAAAEKRWEELQLTSARLQRNIDQQRLTLENLRVRSAQFEESARAAEAELLAFERSCESKKSQHDEELAKLEAQKLQLNQRIQKVENGEKSLRIRETELEEFEAQLRCEIEQRERQLSQQIRDFDELRESLRARH